METLKAKQCNLFLLCVLILITGSKGNRFSQARIRIGMYTYEYIHFHKFKRMCGFSISG